MCMGQSDNCQAQEVAGHKSLDRNQCNERTLQSKSLKLIVGSNQCRLNLMGFKCELPDTDQGSSVPGQAFGAHG